MNTTPPLQPAPQETPLDKKEQKEAQTKPAFYKRRAIFIGLAVFVIIFTIMGALYFYAQNDVVINPPLSTAGSTIDSTTGSNTPKNKGQNIAQYKGQNISPNIETSAVGELVVRLLQAAPYDDLLPSLTDKPLIHQNKTIKTILAPLIPLAARGVPNAAQIQSLYLTWRLSLSLPLSQNKADTTPAPPPLLVWLHNISGGRITLTPIPKTSQHPLQNTLPIATPLKIKRLLYALDDAARLQDFATALRVSEHLALALNLDEDKAFMKWRTHTLLYVRLAPTIARLIDLHIYNPPYEGVR
ncbi:MAG: hypothetical protein HAW65_06730 [Alphaproteobacteria bacterium]|nr:hypothetical protein [Alphaproteobacteria bacterium]